MKIKKYVVAIIVLTTLLLAPAIASAQYSDSISDSTGDVFHWEWDGTSYRWRENVERPDIDITGASIRESGGYIYASIEVKGTIRATYEIHYNIMLVDEDGESYDIWYTDGVGYIQSPYFYGTLEQVSGVGTSTLEVVLSLEDLGYPASLEIASVETHDWLDDVESGEYYLDTAGPEADEPIEDDDEDDDNDEFEFDEGIIDDLIERGMWCLALIIIIPIVIIIIIIIVLVKVLGKDDKGGEEPPKQYQQPPPSSGQPPKQNQGGQGGQTPPPPPGSR